MDAYTRLIVIASVIGLTLFSGLHLSAAEVPADLACNIAEQPTDIPPQAEGSTTKINIGVTLVDLVSIDDIEQTVSLDILARLKWIDPRLARYAGCRVSAEKIWRPQIQMLNAGSFKPRTNPEYAIGEAGEVTGIVRIAGDVLAPHRIDAFPFDRQLITLQFMSVRYSSDILQLQIDNRWTMQNKVLSIPDWRIGQIKTQVIDTEIAHLDERYSSLQLLIPAARAGEYYMYKVLFPLTIIIIMSWASFWIDPKLMAPQLSVAVTSMLTLIAFQFAQGAILPRVSYFTLMDRFILIASVLVFLALVVTVTTGYLTSKDRWLLACRLDWHCRWLFPLVFVLATVDLFAR